MKNNNFECIMVLGFDGLIFEVDFFCKEMKFYQMKAIFFGKIQSFFLRLIVSIF